MKTKNQHIRVYVQPICGDVPCVDEDEVATALLVKRITVDGNELWFSKAKITADNNDVLTLQVEFMPGRLEVLHRLSPWEDEQ